MVEFMGKIQISSFFPQSENFLNSKMSDKTKLANALTMFNNNSDVMMTSFIVKEGSETIRFLGLAILLLVRCFIARRFGLTRHPVISKNYN